MLNIEITGKATVHLGYGHLEETSKEETRCYQSYITKSTKVRMPSIIKAMRDGRNLFQ